MGVLTPSGGEVGPFRTIEQSSIASLVPHEERSDIYAWDTFLGTFCSAIGSIFAGTLIDFVQGNFGFSVAQSYKCVFWAYSFLAVICVILCLFITNDIEVKPEEDSIDDDASETTRLITQPEEATTTTKRRGNLRYYHL